MYYSQFGEDQWIVENIPLPEKGIYVDVGAGNPIVGNNTYFLQKKGWDGLSIDADPRTFKDLIEKRQDCFFSVIGGDNGFRTFYLNPTISDLSSLTPIDGAKTILSPEFTLIRVLDALGEKYENIDLLSVDVEGHEIEVLSPFLAIRKPRIVICEYNTSGIKKLEEVKSFLGDQCGYEIAHISEANIIATV